MKVYVHFSETGQDPFTVVAQVTNVSLSVKLVQQVCTLVYLSSLMYCILYCVLSLMKVYCVLWHAVSFYLVTKVKVKLLSGIQSCVRVFGTCFQIIK